MTEHYLFYAAFLIQILTISVFLPGRVLRRMRHVVSTYPPAEYPRLYPVPLEEVERAQRTYRHLNLAAAGIGFALFASGVASPGADLLGWDTLAVMSLFLMVQIAPLAVTVRPGFAYFNPTRRRDDRARRSAELRPRRLFDFVSPAFVGLAVAVYLAFAAFVVWVNRFDYSWFGGYWNIVGITFGNLFFTGGILYTLRRPRRDPYQAPEDRRRQIGFSVRALVFTSIAATLSVTLSIVLAMLELRPLIPPVKSLYFVVLAAVCFREFRIDGVDFEVYREGSAAA